MKFMYSYTYNITQAVMAALASFQSQFNELLGTPVFVENMRSGIYRVYTCVDNKIIFVAQFSMSQLHGCCGVVVSYHASVERQFRGKGVGKLLLKVREKAAIIAGFTVIQATVRKDNPIQIKILKDAGWREIEVFTNKRTKNVVIQFSKTLA